MLDPIVRGGPVMVPLLLCSVVAVVVSVERWLYLRHANVDLTRLMSKVRVALERGSPEEAKGLCNATPGPVARVLAGTLERFHLPKEELREAAREIALSEQPALDRRLPALATIVTISPMLGLLGTVAGLIRIFHAVGAERIGNAAGLSTGISEALICTFTGLAIAVPFWVVHNALAAKVDAVVNDIELRTTELLNLHAELGVRV